MSHMEPIAKTSERSALARIRAIERGLPVARLERFRKRHGLTQEELVTVLGSGRATFHRRKSEARLTPAESERYLRLERIWPMAVELFGGDEAAVEWLRRPLAGLGGRTPLEALRTDVGAGEVEARLGRALEGVF